MGHARGTSGESPIDYALKTVIREHATLVRLATGICPQIHFFAPHQRNGKVFEQDIAVNLEVAKLTSDDINGFVESAAVQIDRNELENRGQTHFLFEFTYEKRAKIFEATIFKKGESVEIMLRLLTA